jgi:CO/xanthine dehydrogenase Mo-binding subunit
MAPRPATRDIYGARLSRRQFVKTGGALVVGVSVLGLDGLKQAARAAAGKNELDPTLPASWIEIHADNTFLIRTGRCDFGQSTIPVAYRQIVAEELNVAFEAITTVMSGDTDRTPDGGPSVDLLGRGAPNLRKAAAYTYQALLDLGAAHLGVPKDRLSVKDGVVSGGGKSVSYGDLVRGQQLRLTIPVTGSLAAGGIVVSGNPPTKPVSQYSVVGKSYLNDVVASKVSAKEVWVSDVRLPGMLHGRMVHPRTLGSTLVSVGQLDKTRFPNAQVVVQHNLVGVVAPSEWEAIRAAQQVAAATKWTDWKGLPGSDNVFKWMRDGADWKTTPLVTSEKSTGDVDPALARATKKVTATYEMPYIKHAPIGPPVCVADVRTDGTVHVHTHNQNPQTLRFLIARMLNTSADHVVVRAYAGSGHYGRSNGGNPGAEDEAVLLSKAVGKPVRLQWMRAEDFQWSTQSPIGYSDVHIALNTNGTIAGYKADHHMPAMQDDRLVAALLAGLPTISAPDVPAANGSGGTTVNRSFDPWHYDRIENVLEHGHGTFQIGQHASPIAVGLRDHSLRTPGQFQQNHPRELAMSEAAAAAGVDALTFRLRHTKDSRLIGVLEAVRDASGWENRAAPRPTAAAAGSAPVTGQGVSVMVRKGGYWACVCQVQVVPATGKITVTKYAIALDLGIVVNPLQLKRQVEGGAIMGISHALLEEATFDESMITSRDWRSYPILTMADVPEITVVMLNRPEVGDYKQGSETANALAAPAIAAALFDATGKIARRLPLRPAYVQALLRA